MSEPLIKADALTKEYTTNDGLIRAVDNVSLDIERGEIVGMLGPNGAGKTTTIKSILGLVTPTDGTVTVEGVDPNEDSLAAYRKISAVLEGARNIYWRLTPEENIRFFAGLQGKSTSETAETPQQLLEKVGLESKADEPVRDLSRGMKQRVSIACALARETPVLFLDEPTLGLDVESSKQLRGELQRLVEEENRTIIISSHNMDVVQELCDRVVIMNEGSVIVDDHIDELMDLFEFQGYRIELDQSIPPGTLNQFDIDWDTRNGEQPTFEAVFPEPEELFSLMTTLQEVGVTVSKMETIEPDLEEIFIEITNRDAPKEITA